MSDFDLRQGDVVWASLGPGTGREQTGRRPCVVVSGADYIEVVTTLITVVPVTKVERGWSNHVALHGPTKVRGHVMTEQPMTISRERLHRPAGHVAGDCLDEILSWIHDFLHDPQSRSVT